MTSPAATRTPASGTRPTEQVDQDVLPLYAAQRQRVADLQARIAALSDQLPSLSDQRPAPNQQSPREQAQAQMSLLGQSLTDETATLAKLRDLAYPGRADSPAQTLAASTAAAREERALRGQEQQTALDIIKTTRDGIQQTFSNNLALSNALLNLVDQSTKNAIDFARLQIERGTWARQDAEAYVKAVAQMDRDQIDQAIVVGNRLDFISDQERWNAQHLMPPGKQYVDGFAPSDDVNQVLRDLGYPPHVIAAAQVDPERFRPENLIARAESTVKPIQTAEQRGIPALKAAIDRNAQLELPPAPKLLTAADVGLPASPDFSGFASQLAALTQPPAGPPPAEPLDTSPDAAAARAWAQSPEARRLAAGLPAQIGAPVAPTAAVPPPPAPAGYAAQFAAANPGQPPAPRTEPLPGQSQTGYGLPASQNAGRAQVATLPTTSPGAGQSPDDFFEVQTAWGPLRLPRRMPAAIR